MGKSFGRRGSTLDNGTSFARGPWRGSIQANGCTQANDAVSSPFQVAPPPQEVASAPGAARCRCGTMEKILPDGKVLHRRRKAALTGAAIAVKATRRASCDAGHGGCRAGTASTPPPPLHGDGTSGGVVGMLSAMVAGAQPPPQQQPPHFQHDFQVSAVSTSPRPGPRALAVAFAAERQELKDALEA